jgi:hypothetical protein
MRHPSDFPAGPSMTKGGWTSGGSVRLKRPMRPLCGSVRLKRPLCGSVRLKRLMRPKVPVGFRRESRGIPHLAKNERDVGHPGCVRGTGLGGSVGLSALCALGVRYTGSLPRKFH